MLCFHALRCLALGFLLPRDATATSLQRRNGTATSNASDATVASGARVSEELSRRPITVSVGGFEDGGDDIGFSLRDTDDPEKAVYDHMPKAGGTFLIQLIRSAVGAANFERITEFENLTNETVNSAYVIGSVRNPCDYYLSLWAYGAEAQGAMWQYIPEKKKYLYNTTSPWKNSTEDIKLFRGWVKMINKVGQPGIMSVRMARSYADMDMDIVAQKPPRVLDIPSLNAVRRALSTNDFMKRVDCWVKAERLDSNTRKCLRRWSRRTSGTLDWAAYRQTLNDGFEKSSAHGRCNEYFTPEMEQLVREAEAPIFDDFNYGSCCAP